MLVGRVHIEAYWTQDSRHECICVYPRHPYSSMSSFLQQDIHHFRWLFESPKFYSRARIEGPMCPMICPPHVSGHSNPPWPYAKYWATARHFIPAAGRHTTADQIVSRTRSPCSMYEPRATSCPQTREACAPADDSWGQIWLAGRNRNPIGQR